MRRNPPPKKKQRNKRRICTTSGHRRADLLQDQEHRAVPRPQPGEVRGEALVEGGEASVLGGFDEAVEDARVEGGICCFCLFILECRNRSLRRFSSKEE